MVEDGFEIGGENLLAKDSASSRAEGDSKEITNDSCYEVFRNIHARLATLLKSETVSLFLGAGASRDCGGQIMRTIPESVEQDLIERGIEEQSKIPEWVKVFYLAVRCSSNVNFPKNRQGIRSRYTKLKKKEAEPLDANFEKVLATLHRWHSVVSEGGNRLKVDGTLQIDIKSADLKKCIVNATHALARTCNLPTAGQRSGLTIYETLIRKILARPLDLKRVNIFTLNYDTLVEKAADAMGVTLLDGFVGTQCRVFRPESYEQDLYFPAEATGSHLHRVDRVLRLYKLHGSITWVSCETTSDNPFGVQSTTFDPQEMDPLLIYPTPAKYGETLGLPYSELFRRFASTLASPQSVLFVIGFGFGDEHVNAIIRQALAVPSFTLVIVDPVANSPFVEKLRKRKSSRVWIIKGKKFGTFEGFVNKLLPDLHDGEIRKEALEMYNALDIR